MRVTDFNATTPFPTYHLHEGLQDLKEFIPTEVGNFFTDTLSNFLIEILAGVLKGGEDVQLEKITVCVRIEFGSVSLNDQSCHLRADINL